MERIHPWEKHNINELHLSSVSFSCHCWTKQITAPTTRGFKPLVIVQLTKSEVLKSNQATPGENPFLCFPSFLGAASFPWLVASFLHLQSQKQYSLFDFLSLPLSHPYISDQFCLPCPLYLKNDGICSSQAIQKNLLFQGPDNVWSQIFHVN